MMIVKTRTQKERKLGNIQNKRTETFNKNNKKI